MALRPLYITTSAWHTVHSSIHPLYTTTSAWHAVHSSIRPLYITTSAWHTVHSSVRPLYTTTSAEHTTHCSEHETGCSTQICSSPVNSPGKVALQSYEAQHSTNLEHRVYSTWPGGEQTALKGTATLINA